jgi:hypothetical protein
MAVTRRFVVPLVSFIAGVTVPLAIGATQVHVPAFDQTVQVGRVGIHRAMPNSLVVEARGECFVLTWTPFQVPQKLGMIHFNGTVQAVPLRDAEGRPALASNEGQRTISVAPNAREQRPAAPRAEAPPPAKQRSTVKERP